MIEAAGVFLVISFIGGYGNVEHMIIDEFIDMDTCVTVMHEYGVRPVDLRVFCIDPANDEMIRRYIHTE